MLTDETLPHMPERPPRHQSYLLRCRETRGCYADCASNWRFSLQDPRTGEEQHFADLNALLTFLQAELPGAGGENSATLIPKGDTPSDPSDQPAN